VKRLMAPLLIAILAVSCAVPGTLVYSSGFSFANYDYVVISKMDGPNSSTALYGMDVEFANLMSRYGMKVVGDRELSQMPATVQSRSLFARMSLSASNKRILLAVSFDDVVTGKTGSSITTYTKGNLFNVDARTKAFEAASNLIVQALQKDKGLIITTEKNQ
jgi:hypothetical protein